MHHLKALYSGIFLMEIVKMGQCLTTLQSVAAKVVHSVGITVQNITDATNICPVWAPGLQEETRSVSWLDVVQGD